MYGGRKITKGSQAWIKR